MLEINLFNELSDIKLKGRLLTLLWCHKNSTIKDFVLFGSRKGSWQPLLFNGEFFRAYC